MNNLRRIWRVIESVPAGGSTNMAVDEALLASFDQSGSAPVLRVYSWAPPALSIGRFQNPLDEVDLDRCRKDGVQAVRRITGGGSLFHADELTYSIVCTPDMIPGASTVKDSFRVLTGFLLDFYRRLGLTACYAADSVSEQNILGVRTAFCFAGRESFDILTGGKKIGGNAQRRMKNIIFQHGSIPILNRAADGLLYMKDKNSEFADGVTSLADCGVNVDLEILKKLLVESFSNNLGVDVSPGRLTEMELSMSESLRAGKYETDLWNLHGEAG